VVDEATPEIARRIPPQRSVPQQAECNAVQRETRHLLPEVGCSSTRDTAIEAV
jgi:hypothetical protein